MAGSNSCAKREHAMAGMIRLVAVGLIVAMTNGCATTQSVDRAAIPVSKAHAHRDLGIDYLSSQKTAMAIRELRASLEEDSADPQTHLWLGEAYRRKRESERALEVFDKAAKLASDQQDIQAEQDARLNLSGLLSQMGRHQEAIPHCEARFFPRSVSRCHDRTWPLRSMKQSTWRLGWGSRSSSRQWGPPCCTRPSTRRSA